MLLNIVLCLLSLTVFSIDLYETGIDLFLMQVSNATFSNLRVNFSESLDCNICKTQKRQLSFLKPFLYGEKRPVPTNAQRVV